MTNQERVLCGYYIGDNKPDRHFDVPDPVTLSEEVAANKSTPRASEPKAAHMLVSTPGGGGSAGFVAYAVTLRKMLV